MIIYFSYYSTYVYTLVAAAIPIVSNKLAKCTSSHTHAHALHMIIWMELTFIDILLNTFESFHPHIIISTPSTSHIGFKYCVIFYNIHKLVSASRAFAFLASRC